MLTKTIQITARFVLITLLIASAAPASSEVLLIEEVRASMQRDLPANGLTKQAVEDRYGEPQQRHAPVGEPPITRWDYADYSVYFEYDKTINSVLAHGAVVAKSDDPNGS